MACQHNVRRKMNNYLKAALLLWVISGLILAAWLAWSDWQEWLDRPVVIEPRFLQVSREQLRKHHRYHGINYSFQRPDGSWVFPRDGQECKLFTGGELN